MHYQHPELSLAQIHAALGHYFDHQPEFDREIEAGLRRVEGEVEQAKDSPARQRLRRLGKRARASRSTWMCMCRLPSHER